MAKKDVRKEMAPKPTKSSMKIKAKMPRNPLDSMAVGAARSLPMGANAGLREAPMGMKKGGACKGYAKGGTVHKSGIDGIAQKGRTSCKKV